MSLLRLNFRTVAGNTDYIGWLSQERMGVELASESGLRPLAGPWLAPGTALRSQGESSEEETRNQRQVLVVISVNCGHSTGVL